jgi:DNA replication protein DnaC
MIWSWDDRGNSRSCIYAGCSNSNLTPCCSRLARTQVLILDDFLLSSPTETKRRDFLEIIVDRYGMGTTIITSQLPIKEWHEAIDEPTLADAICDRLFHNAYKIELKGPTMRNDGNDDKSQGPKS